MVSLSDNIEGSDLLRSEANRYDLHRFGAATGAAAAAAPQLLDVVPNLGLVCPLLNLLVADHEQIV